MFEATDCLIQVCAHLLSDFCNFFSVCRGGHACSRCAAAEAAVTEAAAAVEFREPSSVSSALRHNVYWNSVLWHDLSQRECVGASVTSACRLVRIVQKRNAHVS